MHKNDLMVNRCTWIWQWLDQSSQQSSVPISINPLKHQLQAHGAEKQGWRFPPKQKSAPVWGFLWSKGYFFSLPEGPPISIFWELTQFWIPVSNEQSHCFLATRGNWSWNVLYLFAPVQFLFLFKAYTSISLNNCFPFLFGWGSKNRKR